MKRESKQKELFPALSKRSKKHGKKIMVKKRKGHKKVYDVVLK